MGRGTPGRLDCILTTIAVGCENFRSDRNYGSAVYCNDWIKSGETIAAMIVS